MGSIHLPFDPCTALAKKVCSYYSTNKTLDGDIEAIISTFNVKEEWLCLPAVSKVNGLLNKGVSSASLQPLGTELKKKNRLLKLLK